MLLNQNLDTVAWQWHYLHWPEVQHLSRKSKFDSCEVFQTCSNTTWYMLGEWLPPSVPSRIKIASTQLISKRSCFLYGGTILEHTSLVTASSSLQFRDLLEWLGHHHLCLTLQRIAFLQQQNISYKYHLMIQLIHKKSNLFISITMLCRMLNCWGTD